VAGGGKKKRHARFQDTEVFSRPGSFPGASWKIQCGRKGKIFAEWGEEVGRTRQRSAFETVCLGCTAWITGEWIRENLLAVYENISWKKKQEYKIQSIDRAKKEDMLEIGMKGSQL